MIRLRNHLMLLLLVLPAAVQAQKLNGISENGSTNNSNSAATNLKRIYTTNLYDGSANIHIPIYSLDGGENPAIGGVSLNYNTRGVRADARASEVGLGWTVNYGGIIQRVIRDIPDEFYKSSFYTDILDYYEGYIDYNRMRGRLAVSRETTAEAAETNVYRDKESDIFNVSAGALNFSFQIGKSGAIFISQNRNIKVEFLQNGQPIPASYPENLTTTLQIKATDERGNIYLFEPSAIESRDLNSEYTSQNMANKILTYSVVTEWVLKKVIFMNSSEIVFNFTDVPVNFENFQWSVFEKYGESPVINSVPQNTMYKKIITSIQYPNSVVVDFNYETDPNINRCDGEKALRSISVSSESSCKKFIFEQAYFAPAFEGNTNYEMPYGSNCSTNNGGYKLKLKGISMADCNNSLSPEPYYSFEYHTTPISAKNSGTDYYGYNNGKSAVWHTNTTPPYAPVSGFSQYITTPFHTGVFYSPVSFGLDKTPDINFRKAGVLTAVKNGFGGRVEFEYEDHVLSNVLDNLLPNIPTDDLFYGKEANDGLRLKSISEHNKFSSSHFLKTTFQYENGQRFLTGGYFHSNSRMEDGVSNSCMELSFSSNFVTPQSPYFGSNHGYGKVTVSTLSQGLALIGKTEYTFTNFMDASSNNQPRYLLVGGNKHYFEYPFTNKQYIKDWEMGLPLTEKQFDENGNLVSEISNTYSFELDSTTAQTKEVLNEKVYSVPYFGAPVIASNYGGSGTTIFDQRRTYDHYRPYTGRALVQATNTKSYVSDNSFILDARSYGYDAKGNPSYELYQDSRGNSYKKKYIYNYNVTSTPGHIIHTMNAAGLEYAVGTEIWKLGSGGTQTNRLMDATINTYQLQNGKVLNSSLYQLVIPSPVLYGDYTGYYGSIDVPEPHQNIDAAFEGQNIAYFEKISTVHLYDNIGNPTETYLNRSDEYKAMIWDEASGNKLAEANCRLQEMSYTGFENAQQGGFNYQPLNVGVTGLQGSTGYWLGGSAGFSRTDLLPGKEYYFTFWTTISPSLLQCTFNGGNLTLSEEAAKGSWKFYRAKFTVTAPGQTLSLNASSAGPLDEVRVHPVNTMMNSWTYTPLWGARSETNSRGRIIFYEYDGLGRQTIVRDQEGNILSKTEVKIQ